MDKRPTDRVPDNELDLDNKKYPTGRDGTVWATFDLLQADIIRNALLTQHIPCELSDVKKAGKMLHLLHVPRGKDADDAMDFIWRETSGLRLKPDWSYEEGETNKSFELWLSGR